jgi:hypothetical protein
MSKFIFKHYDFDHSTLTASFRYGFQNGLDFKEEVQFASAGDYDQDTFDRALFLSFILVGTSYYKLFPSVEVELEVGTLDAWQVDFFNAVYQDGMSQFAYENHLTRRDLAHFSVTTTQSNTPKPYKGRGALALQSGGKDSLLTTSMLLESGQSFTPWYISYSPQHPAVLDTLGTPLRIVTRNIDRNKIASATELGGLNGHVPVTYIVYSFAVIDAILSGSGMILASIGHEGEEPHAWIGDLPVNHQWAKTWSSELAMADYVTRYIAPGLQIGSPLRIYSELKIVEMFVEYAWQKFGHSFSSCNVANYKQGKDNSSLYWCSNCPKCASSFLMFAAFLPAGELMSIFSNQDLFSKESLTDTFKGLLGIDGFIKPFECVGEIDELRLAYHKAQSRGGYSVLPFEVPLSSFDYQATYPGQDWANLLI